MRIFLDAQLLKNFTPAEFRELKTTLHSLQGLEQANAQFHLIGEDQETQALEQKLQTEPSAVTIQSKVTEDRFRTQAGQTNYTLTKDFYLVTISPQLEQIAYAAKINIVFDTTAKSTLRQLRDLARQFEHVVVDVRPSADSLRNRSRSPRDSDPLIGNKKLQDFASVVLRDLDSKDRYSFSFGTGAYTATVALVAATISSLSFTIIGELSAETLNQKLFKNTLADGWFYTLFAFTALPQAVFAGVNLVKNEADLRRAITDFFKKTKREAELKGLPFHEFVKQAVIGVLSSSQSAYQTFKEFILNPSEKTQKLPLGLRWAAFGCTIATGISSNTRFVALKHSEKHYREHARQTDGDLYAMRLACIKLSKKFAAVVQRCAGKSLDSNEAKMLVTTYQSIKRLTKEHSEDEQKSSAALQAYMNKMLTFIQYIEPEFKLESLVDHSSKWSNTAKDWATWTGATLATIAAVEQSIQMAKLIFGDSTPDIRDNPYENLATLVGCIFYLANYDANVEINSQGLRSFFGSIADTWTDGVHFTERGWLEFIEYAVRPMLTILSGVGLGVASSYFPLVSGASGISTVFGGGQGTLAAVINTGIGWDGFRSLCEQGNQLYYQSQYGFADHTQAAATFERNSAIKGTKYCNTTWNREDKVAARRQLDFISQDLAKDATVITNALLQAEKHHLPHYAPVAIQKTVSKQYHLEQQQQVSAVAKNGVFVTPSADLQKETSDTVVPLNQSPVFE